MDFRIEALEILGLGDTNAASIRDLESNLDQLVPFVGAGLSVEFGLPTWSGRLRQIAGAQDAQTKSRRCSWQGSSRRPRN